MPLVMCAPAKRARERESEREKPDTAAAESSCWLRAAQVRARRVRKDEMITRAERARRAPIGTTRNGSGATGSIRPIGRKE